MCDHVADSERNVSIADKLQSRLSRHIVPLSCLDVADGRNKDKSPAADLDADAFCISSFVISLRGFWFLITAGHIIPLLKKRSGSGRRILKWRLLTQIAAGKRCDPIPCDLANEPTWYVDQGAIDCAAIALRPFYVEGLRADGVCPLTETQWTNVPPSAGGYYLLGFPEQIQEKNVRRRLDGGDIDHTVWMPFLPLCPTDDPPQVLRSDAPRFYAHVPWVEGPPRVSRLEFRDISGMSGGPIFAVRDPECDDSEYWLLAVQSSWEAGKRVLAASFMETIVEEINSWIDSQGSKLEGYQAH